MDDGKVTTQVEKPPVEKPAVDPMVLELERVNTLLATTENSLRETVNERNSERALREKHERRLVSLLSDVALSKRVMAELEKKLKDKDGEIEKANAKRRHEVQKAEALKSEAEALKRANEALRRQVEAAGKAVDNFFDGPDAKPSDEPQPPISDEAQ